MLLPKRSLPSRKTPRKAVPAAQGTVWQHPRGPATRTVPLKVSDLAEMGLAGDKEAQGSPGAAWPGGCRTPAQGTRLGLCPTFASLALFWGVLSPASGAHPPEPALCLLKDQRVRKTIGK